MADLVLRLKSEADYQQIKNFKGPVEDLVDLIEDLKATGDEAAKTYGLNFKAGVQGIAEVKDLYEITKQLSPEQEKLAQTIKKKTQAEAGSIASARGLVSALTQQRNYLRYNSDEWKALDAALQAAVSKQEQAKGVQNGSIAQIQRLNKQLREQQTNLNLTEKAYAELEAEIRQNNAAIRIQSNIQKGSKRDLQDIRAELIQARDATNKFTDPEKYRQLSAEIQEVESSLSALESPFKRLANFVDTIGRIRVAIDAVNDAFRIVNGTINTFVTRTKQVESFNIALQNIGLNAQESNRAFQQATKTSLELGAPLANVERSYKRMIPSLQAIGVSSADSDKFIAQLAARTQVLGLNTEESGRLVEAFAQVLSKGKLSGEELNQQISELDGAFRTQLADALGVSTSELVKLVEAGNIGSADFAQAFLRMDNGVQLLGENLESGNGTIQQFQNQIATLNTKNVEAVGQAFDPLFKAILRSQLALTQFFATLAQSSFLTAFGQIAGDVVDSLTFFSKIILQVGGGLIKFVEPLGVLLTELVKFEVLGIRIGHVLGALLAIFASNAIVAVFTSKIAGLVGAVASGVGPLGFLTKSIGGLGAILNTIKTQGFVKAMLQAGQAALSFTKLNVVQYFTRFFGIVSKVAGVGLRLVSALLTIKGALVTLGVGAIAVVVKGFMDYRAGADQAKIATEKAEQALKKYNEQMGNVDPETPGIFQQIANAAGQLVQPLTRVFKDKSFNDNLNGFRTELEKADVAINKIAASSAKYGGALTQNTNLTKLSNDAIMGQKATLDAELQARKERLKVLEAQIQKYKQEHPEQKTTIAALEQEAQASRGLVAAKEQIVQALDAEIARRIENGEQIGTTAQRLQVLTSAVQKAGKEKDLLNATVEAKSYQDLANGIITAEQAEAQRTAAKAIGLGRVLETLKNEQRELENIKNSSTGLNETQKARYEELQTLIPQTTSQQVQAFQQVKTAIVDAYARGIEEVNKLQEIAAAAASRIKATFDAVASGATSGIQAGLQVVQTLSAGIQADIDRETRARIKGAEAAGLKGVELENAKNQISAQGEARKRAVLEQELRTRAEMADIEYEIESLRIGITARVKAAEAEALQARLQGEAAIARARGDNDAAQALEKAAALQGVVVQGVQAEAQIQQQILGFRRDQQKATIASQAAAAGIAGLEVPGIKTAIGNLKNFANSARNTTREFGKMADQANQVGRNLNNKNISNGEKKAGEMSKSIRDAANETGALSKGMQSVASSFSKSVNSGAQLLGIIQSINRATGISARAMGGPVEAGGQYLVNDGGGREAFLNSFGRMSMLPPGRNIKWTAPSSGMVIPAHLVEDFRNKLMARERMEEFNSYKKPSPSVSRNIIRSSSRSSVASSSSSQRIVNHVTIQSQSPLTDASRLMANVSRIKARRRI